MEEREALLEEPNSVPEEVEEVRNEGGVAGKAAEEEELEISLAEAEKELICAQSATSAITSGRKRGASFNTLKKDWEGELDRLTFELDDTRNIVRERTLTFGGFEPSFLRDEDNSGPPRPSPDLFEDLNVTSPPTPLRSTSATPPSNSPHIPKDNSDEDINLEYVSKEVLAKQVKRYKHSLESEKRASVERDEDKKKLEEELMQLKLSYEKKKRKTVALKSQKRTLEGYVVKISEKVEVPSYEEFQKEEIYIQPKSPQNGEAFLPLTSEPSPDTYWISLSQEKHRKKPNYQARPECFSCTIS